MGQVKGYKTKNGKSYVGIEVNLGDEGPNLLFVQALVIGKVSLYQYREFFFVTKDDSVSVQIKMVEKEEYVGEKRVIRKTYTNLGKLSYLLSDCSLLPSVTGFRILTERNLTNLIVDYNECTSENFIVFKNEKPWTSFSFGVAGGMNSSNISFTSTQTLYIVISEGTFSTSKSLALMASLAVSSPRINERISFRTDILYHKSSFTALISNNYRDFLNNEQMDFSLHSVTLPVTFQYMLKKKILNPYLNLGISYQRNFGTEMNYVREIGSKDTPYIEEKAEPFVVKKALFGFTGTVGLSKSFSAGTSGFIELRAVSAENFHATNFDEFTGIAAKQITSSLLSLSLMAGINF
ncbi:outer membrane beta-barrel protein [Nafulsella turpanensis]|uniref:outer membrane beta-barrel protein n=1 Tax=Nafulsella turpanensis TaxID=1265690 RepID=UPI00135F17F8|nr:outer membrane beta-barrel protein [Nafulsella turpanensis]